MASGSPVLVPSVWSLVRDPDDTCAVIADGLLDDHLEALEDAARRWAVSRVRRAVWERQRALEAKPAPKPKPKRKAKAKAEPSDG